MNLNSNNLANSLKLKVKFITMMMKMFKTLREENELIMKLKGFCPGNKIPRGILMQGPEALKTGKLLYILSFFIPFFTFHFYLFL